MNTSLRQSSDHAFYILQVLLFHQDACEAVSEEALVELCDWCARCVAYLASQEARRHAAWTGGRGGHRSRGWKRGITAGCVEGCNPAACSAARAPQPDWSPQARASSAAASRYPKFLFNRHVCEALPPLPAPATRAERSLQERVSQPPLEELRERAGEVRFGAAQCGLTILRYLTDHPFRLSLSVLARIVSDPQIDPAVAPHANCRRSWHALSGGGALCAS